MQQSRITVMLFCAAMTFFLISCNNNADKTSTDSDTNNKQTVTTENPPAAPTSTIVTTPQGMMAVTHKVADFDKWKASYDAHDSLRLAFGIHSYVIGRAANDPNTLFVATKVDDMAKAKAFAKDPSLKQAMQKGGVMGTPKMSFTTMVWQDTATISAPFRSRTTFTVKDWNAWVKSFDEGKQERMDNGIIARGYGHDPDNDKKVTLVTAFTDSTKAAAYWNSDALKKRRAAGGVIGTPERFVFRVVQRY
jgi:hypothetical protein